MSFAAPTATHRRTLQRNNARRGNCPGANDTAREVPVKITLVSDNAIKLEPIVGPMTIEAPTAEQSYSPFHMMASALAYCTFSVMYAWAEHAELEATDLVLDVAWTFAEDPHRVDHYDLTFHWPSLPPNRLQAAKRVAELCTVHATLQHPPVIDIHAHEAAPPLSTAEAGRQT
jgi:uncharacterized OsmC-like protein